MTSWSKQFMVVLAVTSVSLAGCASSSGNGNNGGAKSADTAGSGHAEVGKPAPELSVQTLNDKGKISLDGLQGKVVIVDFWATWCGPCKQSFPKLEELSKKVGDKVVIVGISVDDEKKGVAEFAKENGATFAIGWDDGHTIASRWKVGTMPTTFIVDASGKVRHIHDGYHDGETNQMEKECNALVAEGPGDSKSAKSGDDKDKGDKDKDKDKGDKPDKDKGDKPDKAEKDKPDGKDAAGDGDEEEKPKPKPKKKKKPKGKPKKPTT